MVCMSAGVLLLQASKRWRDQHDGQLPRSAADRASFKQLLNDMRRRNADLVPLDVSVGWCCGLRGRVNRNSNPVCGAAVGCVGEGKAIANDEYGAVLEGRLLADVFLRKGRGRDCNHLPGVLPLLERKESKQFQCCDCTPVHQMVCVHPMLLLCLGYQTWAGCCVTCWLQEENFDEALKAAFHAWTKPSIREWYNPQQLNLVEGWGDDHLMPCVHC
jgi:hypothetical protein